MMCTDHIVFTIEVVSEYASRIDLITLLSYGKVLCRYAHAVDKKRNVDLQ